MSLQVEEGPFMPRRRYEHREPTHGWQQIQPLLKDTAQINYEVIRPVVLWGQTPKERGAEEKAMQREIFPSFFCFVTGARRGRIWLAYR